MVTHGTFFNSSTEKVNRKRALEQGWAGDKGAVKRKKKRLLLNSNFFSFYVDHLLFTNSTNWMSCKKRLLEQKQSSDIFLQAAPFLNLKACSRGFSINFWNVRADRAALEQLAVTKLRLDTVVLKHFRRLKLLIVYFSVETSKLKGSIKKKPPETSNSWRLWGGK